MILLSAFYSVRARRKKPGLEWDSEETTHASTPASNAAPPPPASAAQNVPTPPATTGPVTGPPTEASSPTRNARKAGGTTKLCNLPLFLSRCLGSVARSASPPVSRSSQEEEGITFISFNNRHEFETNLDSTTSSMFGQPEWSTRDRQGTTADKSERSTKMSPRIADLYMAAEFMQRASRTQQFPSVSDVQLAFPLATISKVAPFGRSATTNSFLVSPLAKSNDASADNIRPSSNSRKLAYESFLTHGHCLKAPPDSPSVGQQNSRCSAAGRPSSQQNSRWPAISSVARERRDHGDQFQPCSSASRQSSFEECRPTQKRRSFSSPPPSLLLPPFSTERPSTQARSFPYDHPSRSTTGSPGEARRPLSIRIPPSSTSFPKEAFTSLPAGTRTDVVSADGYHCIRRNTCLSQSSSPRRYCDAGKPFYSTLSIPRISYQRRTTSGVLSRRRSSCFAPPTPTSPDSFRVVPTTSGMEGSAGSSRQNSSHTTQPSFRSPTEAGSPRQPHTPISIRRAEGCGPSAYLIPSAVMSALVTMLSLHAASPTSRDPSLRSYPSSSLQLERSSHESSGHLSNSGSLPSIPGKGRAQRRPQAGPKPLSSFANPRRGGDGRHSYSTSGSIVGGKGSLMDHRRPRRSVSDLGAVQTCAAATAAPSETGQQNEECDGGDPVEGVEQSFPGLFAPFFASAMQATMGDAGDGNDMQPPVGCTGDGAESQSPGGCTGGGAAVQAPVRCAADGSNMQAPAGCAVKGGSTQAPMESAEEGAAMQSPMGCAGDGSSNAYLLPLARRDSALEKRIHLVIAKRYGGQRPDSFSVGPYEKKDNSFRQIFRDE